jgi:serine/threonine protein kinase
MPAGTFKYSAPEVFFHKSSQRRISSNIDLKATDCWSLGVLLYYMLTKTLPFTIDALKQLKAKPVNEELEIDMSLINDLRAQSLLKLLLVLNPTKRLKAAAILNHEYLFEAAQQVIRAGKCEQ